MVITTVGMNHDNVGNASDTHNDFAAWVAGVQGRREEGEVWQARVRIFGLVDVKTTRHVCMKKEAPGPWTTALDEPLVEGAPSPH